MLTYYTNTVNSYTIRTENTSSNQYTMSLQDMFQLNNITASLSSASFTAYENLLAFTMSISGAVVGGEYRAELRSSGSSEPIWHGSVQIFSSSVALKSQYENKIQQFVSYESANEYKEYIIQ